jgi:hypothetical protein
VQGQVSSYSIERNMKMKHIYHAVVPFLILCGMLSFQGTARAQYWSFMMLDQSSNPVTNSLTINLPAVQTGAIPVNDLLSINGIVSNFSSSPGTLYLGGLSVSSTAVSPVWDGQPYFTWNGASTPNTLSAPGWLGSSVDPGNNLVINLGTFDASAFLNALPVDGMQHTATLNFEVNAVDANGSQFDPNNASIIPGPPSLQIMGQVNPAGGPGPNVPEPGVLGMLMSLSTVAGGWLLKRRA